MVKEKYETVRCSCGFNNLISYGKGIFYCKLCGNKYLVKKGKR